MDEHRLWSRNWEIVEHFLTQCAVQFPHSFDYVARVIAWRVRTKGEIDRKLWSEVAGLTALQAGQLGRDSEVAWAIWLLKELEKPIQKGLSDTLLTNSGPLVLCFLAHFPKHQLANDQKLCDRLRDMVDGEPFAGVFWPLTLELAHLGKGNPKWAKHPTVAALRSLHDAKVSIIDWSAPPKVFIRRPLSGDDSDNGGGATDTLPEFAIEDYGSDYSEDDEDRNDEGDAEDDENSSFPTPS